MKKIPSVSVMSGDEETLTNPVIVTRGQNTLLGVPVDKRFVLRMGKQVVGMKTVDSVKSSFQPETPYPRQ